MTSTFAAARAALISRVLEGAGHAAQAARRAAFEGRARAALGSLIDKLNHRPDTISDADFAAARSAGCDEDQLFELVVCAAVGQAARQHDRALTALRAALRDDHASSHPRQRP